VAPNCASSGPDSVRRRHRAPPSSADTGALSPPKTCRPFWPRFAPPPSSPPAIGELPFHGTARGAILAGLFQYFIRALVKPLAAGLVRNLSRPGGNLTGVTCINSDLAGKRVEILQEALRRVAGLGVMLDPDDKRMASELRETERAVQASSIPVHALRVTSASEIETAFSAAAINKISGVVVVFDSLTFFHRARLAEIALRHRMPTIFNFKQYVEAGGLISYGPNLADMYRQSARHIRKVLNGEKPGEIPMEQPPHFELVVNLKTAKALGLEIPPMLLGRADEAIE
jgi:putative ABC transport system substrate-binding protein